VWAWPWCARWSLRPSLPAWRSQSVRVQSLRDAVLRVVLVGLGEDSADKLRLGLVNHIPAVFAAIPDWREAPTRGLALRRPRLRRLRNLRGSFRVEGLLTKVRVKVVRGNVPCRNAKRVMKRLFKGRNTRKWDCVGPQTGYAACTRGDSKITARF
jgi:hypothetical protein